MATQPRTFSQADVTKRISIWTIIGIILGLFLAYLLFRPIIHSFSKNLAVHVDKGGPVELGAAKTSLGDYRMEGALAALAKHWKGKTSGIIQDFALFNSDYVQKTFKEFSDSHDPYAGYKWQLGLYPTISYQEIDGKQVARLNVFFIPTMYNETSGSALDYLGEIDKPADKNCYIKTNGKPWQDGRSYIYDQGTLFP